MEIKQSIIALNNIRLRANHGVISQEQLTGGDFIVSLRVAGNFAKAAETDSVIDTVNYALLFGIVKKEMQVTSSLIEHVAGRIGKSILSQCEKVDAVEVSVTKCNPPMGADCDGATFTIFMNR